MRSLTTLITVGFVSTGSVALASAPAGVWSKPTGVTISGADSDMPTVMITGIFAVHTGQGSEGTQWGFAGFEATTEGYMHFACRSGDKEMCLLQWEDIRAASADKECVGWGEIGLANGVVHEMGSAPGYPDQWNLALGVVTGVTPCNYLDEYSPTGGDAGSDTGSDVADPDPDTAPVEDVPPVQDTAPSLDAGVDSGSPADAPAATDTGPDTVATDTGSGGVQKDPEEGCAGAHTNLPLILGALTLVALARRRSFARR